MIYNNKKITYLLIILIAISILGLCTSCSKTGEIPFVNYNVSDNLQEAIDENNQLENNNEILYKENKRLKRNLSKLLEENNQLKQEIKQIKKSKLEILEKATGLVRVKDIDPSIIIDLKYATSDNFTGQKVYTVPICLLQKQTAEKLKKANQEFIKDGYRIKIWDAYRPFDVQKKFWKLVPDSRYVANPKKGSRHNRGCSVDITLVDDNGIELEMPTSFDDFSQKASRSYKGNSNNARDNLKYMTDIMCKNGFNTINSEWWHFDDTNWEEYVILNIPLEIFKDNE